MAKRKRKRAWSTKGRAPAKKGATISTAISRLGPRIAPRTGLGDRVKTMMLYADRFSINAGAGGAIAAYTFRLNSIFDPDFTGVGHQPMTHDQLTPLFERYCVTGCRYKVVAACADAGGLPFVAVQATDDVSVPTVISTVIEQGQTDWSMVYTGGPNIKTFEGYVSIPKLVGKDFKEYLNSSEYSTPVGNNPSDPAYLNIFAGDSGTGDGPNVNFVIELQYTVYLQGSKIISAS